MNIEEKLSLGDRFNSALITIGILGIQRSYIKMQRTIISFGQVKSALIDVGINIPTSQLDTTYKTTNAKNWFRIIKVVSFIVRFFKWTRETNDCDNRAHAITVLCGWLFGVTTCGAAYNKRFNLSKGTSVLHYANLFIDDKNKVYLYDADNHGMIVELTKEKPFTMGVCNYEFRSAKFF